jgi:hypothetical protein
MGYKIKYSRKERKENKKNKPDKEQSDITFNPITKVLKFPPNCLIDIREVNNDYVYI